MIVSPQQHRPSLFGTWHNSSRHRRSPNLHHPHSNNTSYLLRLPVLLVVVVFVGHRSLSHWNGHRQWVEAPIAHVKRTCTPPEYKTIQEELEDQQQRHQRQEQHQAQGEEHQEHELQEKQQTEEAQPSLQKPKICLATLTDEGRKSRAVRYFGWRNFDGLLKLTEPNKQAYADRHGYHWFDESAVLDVSRPPSWSKIKAAQRLLNEEHCDWVFWLDADTVIMDPSRPVESILSTQHDLLVAPDKGGGYNAGVWLIRNSDWSKHFLQTWWDMKSFVKPPGLAKSGDNDALKHYLAEMERTEEFGQHVAAPARCTFNSFASFVSPTSPTPSSSSLSATTPAVKQQQLNDNLPQTTMQQQRQGRLRGGNIDGMQYYLDEGYYHDGDFIAHVAAVDNKVDTIKVMLALAESKNRSEA